MGFVLVWHLPQELFWSQLGCKAGGEPWAGPVQSAGCTTPVPAGAGFVSLQTGLVLCLCRLVLTVPLGFNHALQCWYQTCFVSAGWQTKQTSTQQQENSCLQKRFNACCCTDCQGRSVLVRLTGQADLQHHFC